MRRLFDQFWDIYPHKRGREDAEQVWNDAGLDKHKAQICDHVKKHKDQPTIYPLSLSPADYLRAAAWAGNRARNVGYESKQHGYRPVQGKQYANPKTWAAHDEQQRLEIISIWEALGKQGLLDIMNNHANPDDYKYKTFKFLGALQREGYLTGTSQKQCCVGGCDNPGALSAGTRGEGPWYCGEHYFEGYARKPGNWNANAIAAHAESHPELQPGHGDGTKTVRERNLEYIKGKLKGGDVFRDLPYDKAKRMT